MTVTASKLSAAIFSIVVIFLVSLPINYFLFFYSLLSAIVLSLGLSVFFGLLLAVSSNDDVEIDEDNQMIGGSSCYTHKKIAVTLRFRTQQFIAKENLNVELSLKRSFVNKLLGEYAFFDKNGRGFKIKRYVFSKKDFQLIQAKLSEVYGMTI